MPNTTGNVETAPASEAIAQELERLAASNSFRKAERCLRLLRYVTDLALQGRGSELKEYALGVAVFDRPASYDPGTDAVVRLEARRLRLKLAEYYQQEGREDPVIIHLPKGAYVPDFRFGRAPQADLETQLVSAMFRHRRRQMWLLAAIACVAILAISGYLFRKRLPPVPVRASIAVLGFQDLAAGKESSWISAGLSELMNIDLGAEQRIRTLPLENVARMQSELSLTPQPAYRAEVLQRIRNNLGVDYVVTGSYLAKAHRIHLNVLLFDARSAQQVAAVSDEAGEDQLPELARIGAQRIQSQLGVRIPAGGQPSLEAAAMEPYARGVEHLRQGDALSARADLEKAAAADPSNPLIHSALAAAWSALGLDIRARREAKLAFDSAAALPRVQQLEIEGRYRVMADDWPRAIEVYQALFTLLPDDLEYGLLLARANMLSGHARDALAAVTALRQLPPPLRDDPRIDLAEAQAAGALSDFARTRKAAQAAADKARTQGSRLLYAKARLLESGAMQNLGIAGFPEVRAEARLICQELGDHACVAAAYRIEGNMTVFTDPLAARRLYLAALEIANQIGNSLEKLNALTGLAYAAQLQGYLPVAENYYQSARSVASEIGPQKSYPISLDLAEVWVHEGRTAEARKLIEQALQIAQQVGEQEGIGLSHAGLARVMEWEGQDSEALVHYNEALIILRRVNGPGLIGATLLDLGYLQLEQGDVPGAQKSFEECRKLGQAYPGGFLAADIEMAFARLSFAENHFPDAASHARLALNGFIAAGREGDRLEAAAVLTRALIEQHSIPEASEVLAQVPFADPRKFPPESVQQLEIARCFLHAHTGRRAEAVQTMDAIQARAARLGPKLEKEALQARNAIAKASDRPGPGPAASSRRPRTAPPRASTQESSRLLAPPRSRAVAHPAPRAISPSSIQ